MAHGWMIEDGNDKGEERGLVLWWGRWEMGGWVKGSLQMGKHRDVD